MPASGTILIVDDSATDASRVRSLLSADYNIEVMSDGAEALERISAGFVPDLLILDWVMPGMSGLEVCKFIRSGQTRAARIPIILLTAQYGGQEIVQAFRSGANDYVSKPFVDEELKARVRALLGAKGLLERAESAEADRLTLLSSAPDPMFGIDADGRIDYINEEGIRALNLPAAKIIGNSLEKMIPGLPHSTFQIADVKKAVSDVVIGERIFSPSVRVLPSDSATRTTLALRDVTSRRQTEARRLDFYSVIAHDLRTPISAILIRLELIERGRYGTLADGLLKDLRHSMNSLLSLNGLISDFLELAKLEGVGYKIDRHPVDVAKIIRATVEDFQPLLEKSGLSFRLQEASASISVLGDETRLSQVLANLIGNAIKFTPAGGDITATIMATSDEVEICVIDTGRGIAIEEQPTLFDRFTRASEPNNKTVGTGLGLMIVREVVEAHGGTVGVESRPGVGSKFWIRLPRSLTPAQ